MSETTLPKPLGARFHDAARYASQLHAAQARKGGAIPYVSHLFAVCGIVLEAGGDEDEAIAALLHDGPEDQGGVATLEEIGARFGPRVKAIVEACSDSLVDTTGGARKPPYAERKARYIEHLRAQGDRSTLLVSIADKLHNARSTLADARADAKRGDGSSVWSRFSAPREDVLRNYERLIEAYDAGPLDPRRNAVLDDLRETVAQLRAM